MEHRNRTPAFIAIDGWGALSELEIGILTSASWSVLISDVPAGSADDDGGELSAFADPTDLSFDLQKPTSTLDGVARSGDDVSVEMAAFAAPVC